MGSGTERSETWSCTCSSDPADTSQASPPDRFVGGKHLFRFREFLRSRFDSISRHLRLRDASHRHVFPVPTLRAQKVSSRESAVSLSHPCLHLRPPPSMLSMVCGMVLCASTPLILLVRISFPTFSGQSRLKISTPLAFGHSELARASVARAFPDTDIDSYVCILGSFNTLVQG